MLNFAKKIRFFHMSVKIKPLSLVFASINILCLIFLCIYKKTFWYDEAYTISMVNLSFKKIWDITAHDVHPPLYYFLVKAFTLVFGKSLTAFHFCSLAGIIATLLLGFFQIKRLWGKTTSYVFILLISILPITLFIGIEIRMYSWLLFFVLATAIYGYDSFLHPQKSISFLKFTFFSICASYTHNYGLASSLIIFFVLWLMFIIEKKEKKKLLLSTLCFLVLFSFWIPNLYYQMTSVKESYWIKPISLMNVAYCFLYFTSARLTGIFIQIAHLILFIPVLWTIYIYTKNRKKINLEQIKPALFFISIYLILFLSTWAMSILYKPILIDRYLLSVLGCLILSIAIFTSSIAPFSLKKIKAAGIIILSCIFFVYVWMFVDILQNDAKDKTRQSHLISYLEKKNNKHTIISLEQKSLIPMLTILKPGNSYEYYFSKSEQAIEWITYPFDIKKVNTLEKEADSVLFITDLLEKKDILKKYPQSLENIQNQINTYYLVTQTNTIDSIEIKTAVRIHK